MATRLRLPSFGRALPWGLAALSLLLAFAQGDGRTYVDTRVELTADPGLFLDRVASVWSTTVDLGHVQSGQYVGYLFPMGPYFAGADALGVPMWIAERLWLAAILWLAGWGVVLLLDALYERRRGSVHLVAAVLYLANPYVVVQANRASASLLAYGALPWILLAAHRGLREPRAWLWPAVVAVAVALSSGGTNAATVFWVVLAPIALLAYEVLVLRRDRGDALAFAWRAGAVSVLASAWWVVPALIAGREGPNFLSFTEQPSAIWSTSSMSESLRLLGYWLSYFETGFGIVAQPSSGAVKPYLTNEGVIVATFAIPLLAFGGLSLTRRWRYAPFFGLLGVGALLVMAAGYPAGKPAAGTLEAIYYKVQASQFLRTTYKAGPLLALALACLAGAAAQQLLALAPRLGGRPAVLRWGAAGALAVLLALFAYPLVRGRLIEPEFVYGSIPTEWRTATADAARATPGDRRVMVLPGQLFGAYRWGQTVDPPIAPVLTRHPVLQRTLGHYADPRATQLQEVVDDLLQQGRLVPGQLAPLLELMGVGHVLVAADGDSEQSGESPPSTIAEALRGQAGFERAAAAYGETRRYAPLRGQGGPSVALPDLRRYATPGAGAAEPVRLQALDGSVVLDGDADGIAQLAAGGGLTGDRALFYAGDLDRDAIRGMARRGAVLVFSDTNRRRRLTPALIRGDVGPTLAADEAIPRDVPAFDLFPERGSGDQTVADYADLSRLRAPAPQRNTLGREHRPFAAFDGRIDTAWVPPAPLPSCPCLELALRRPRPVRYIRVHPRALESSAPVPLGISVNGGPERAVRLSPLGWSRVAIDAAPLRSLRLRVLDQPLVGPFGLDEVEIPGVRVRQSLRLPTWLATATRGVDLERNDVVVELQRTTADFPFRPSGEAAEETEAGIARRVALPVARRFGVSGWASPSPEAPDPAFDRLAAMPSGWTVDGSRRFEGRPSNRASSAFDGDPRTAWVADFDSNRRAWLSVRAPAPVTVRELRFLPGPSEYTFPAEVDVEADGRAFPDLRVRADGTVVLPLAVRARSLRVDVTEVDAPTAVAARRRLDAVAVGEVVVPGLRVPAARRAGRFETRCGSVLVRSAGSVVKARTTGSLEALDRGEPARLAGCGPQAELELGAGTALVTATGSPLLPYLLTLRSPGQGGSAPPASPGVVTSQGRGDDGSRNGVGLRLRRAAWLVLGESYSRGWRATCRSGDGAEHDLGSPEPIDGFANGWRVSGTCTNAKFRFAPQRAATISYIVSAIAGAGLLALLAASALARRRRGGKAAPEPGPDEAAPPDRLIQLALPAALALGLGMGLVGGWFFAVRAGLLLGLAVAVIAGVGVTARRLLWAAIPPLAAIPVLYVVDPSPTNTGFFAYANQHQAAHWLAVAAVCALGGACLLDAWGRRRATPPEGSGA